MKTFIAISILIISFIVTIALVPEQASCREKPIRFTLTTTTDQIGLKTVVPPHRARIPKIGLALAGGGAKAAASIGVLKVLEEEGIPVVAVAGTSMGALVGGLYAAGYSPEEIEKLVLENNWNEIFSDAPPRAFQAPEQKEFGSSHLFEFYFRGGKFIPPSGLTAGQKFLNLLTEYTLAASIQAHLDFNRLPVPFRAVATDISTGEAVVLDDGLLHNAIRASTAIPFVFKPVVINGRLLMDGGLVKNLPVDVVRAMKTDLVIAVDPSSEPAQADKLTSLFGIMSQSITLQAQQESRRQAALADVVILPDTAEYTIADFPGMQKIIALGEEAARAALPGIRELLRKKAGRPRRPGRYRIKSLTIKGNRTIPDPVIREHVTVSLPPGEVTGRDIQDAMAAVFELGYFSEVTVDLIQEGKRSRAVLTVTENPLVKNITVSGNRMIPTGEIMDSVKAQVGRTLNTTELASALETIVDRYREQGYRIVRIERAGMNGDGETLEIVLYEGRVDTVRLAGQKRTKESLFRREIRTRPEEPLNVSVLLRDIQHVYGLGYFEHLNIDVQENAHGGLEIAFRVKEKPTGTVRFGLRYDLNDSFTGLTDITVQNWLGKGITLYLNTRYGNYADVTLGYRSPLFPRARFVHSLQGFYRQRDYAIYADNKQVDELDVSRSGAEFAFGYQWFKFGDTAVRYRYTADDTLQAFGAAPEKSVDRIGSLAFLMNIDTRDSSTITHGGLLFKGSYESAEPAYGGDTEYTKTYVFAQGSIPLGRSHTVALEAATGLGSGEIPYHEKFGLGGADYLISYPLLGYERREFVGANLLGFSAAYRLKIKEYQLKAVKAVYLNITGGAANVWDSREAMAFDDLRKGGGIGLHADTIVGPFKLDFGVGEEDRFRVYFSAGFVF